MKRIEELFARKDKHVLNVYCTAGFPKLDSTVEVMESLQKHGADIIELGMPYSDPLADGPVIQASGAAAIANGMTIEVLFEQLRNFRKRIDLPVILMGYLNPVLQYGFERFCNDAAAVGIDGLILPDLPIYEFETIYGPIIKAAGLSFIFLVTPETPESRVMKLDSLSSGFLYAVSSSSTTGNEKQLSDQVSYFERLGKLKLKNPILTGFGIKDRQTFEIASEHTNGAIIGSAYIRALSSGEDVDTATKQFLQSIVKPSYQE